MTTQINKLRVGASLTPIHELRPAVVRHWRFCRECSDIGAGLMPGTDLKIVDIGRTPGSMWVKVRIPGSHPPGYLKIAGDELGRNFRVR